MTARIARWALRCCLLQTGWWYAQLEPPAARRWRTCKYKSDNPADAVEMTRPLCPFPKVARYDRSGPSKDATSFECVVDSNHDNPEAAVQYLR